MPDRTARFLLLASLAALAAGVVAALLGAWAPRLGLPALGWAAAHGALLLAGFVLPALLFLHLRIAAPRCPRPVDARRVRLAARSQLAGAVVLALGLLLAPTGGAGGTAGGVVAWLGLLAVAGGGTTQSIAFFKALPRRGESVVDVARDPLTKGDDASLKHVLFAHRFLPVGLLVLLAALAPVPAWQDGAWAPRAWLAGLHVILVGYALLSVYGLAHLVVPRHSGVPAIAAGAIKGELHSSLPGILFLVAGFLAGAGTRVGRGLLVAAGAFVFLGIFTFMGVLGANIMRNKSRTQRVTPEFAYIPWTFAGVLWLVCGVLMGWFLNAVPDELAGQRAGLRFTHAHFALLGGVAQLYLGLLPRELAAWSGGRIPSFAREQGPFLALNAGLLLLVVGRLVQGADGWAFLAGGLLVLLGLAVHAARLRGLLRPPRHA